jgi:peptide/nickel transport system permease protein
MTGYIIRRLILIVPVALFLTVILFVVLRLTPGDPAQVELGEQATPETVAALHHQLGLDKPVPVQYAIWLGRVVRGNLGKSLANSQSVVSLIGERLPVTLELGILVFVFHLVLAVILGILSAIYRRSLIGPAVTLFASVFFSFPDFFLAILLILLFAVKLQWLPVSGYVPLYGSGSDVVQNLQHMILPVLTLSLGAAAFLARLIRSSLLETLFLDYIRTARAKGLSESTVILRHAMKNAALPVVTLLGLRIGFILSGAFIVEYIFALPGVGRLAVDAISSRDYPIVQGVVLIIALMVMLANLITDISYAAVDPRISYAGGRG